MGSITPINKAKTAGSLTSLPVLAASYQLSLEAQNKSPRTIQTYLEAIARLDAYLVEHGLTGSRQSLVTSASSSRSSSKSARACRSAFGSTFAMA
jgi:hypothetical protein